ncbi:MULTISPECIES: hypothetical protein [Saliphagus]|uniref:Small CPxCG-related zinc finger protein n=1 Tax=Saliphagus infecundisoli TaxID=1849069 RepID=A0ABD5QGF2_9EURY|nr:MULTISPECIES: hypothetical protein [Saliphagus]
MSSPIPRLFRAALGGPASGEFHECRRCGTTVEGGAERCPRCESAEIATYFLQ